MGIQSLNDSDLKFLGRTHSAAEAIHAIEEAKKLFDRFSFDLIYARHSKQTPESWRQELRQALQLGTSHMSLYNLTFEVGTPCVSKFSPHNPPHHIGMFPSENHFSPLRFEKRLREGKSTLVFTSPARRIESHHYLIQ
jgi:hypothetical protein